MVKPGIVRLLDRNGKKINELDNISNVSIWNNNKRICSFWIQDSRTVQIIDNVNTATTETFTDGTIGLEVQVDLSEV